MLVRGSSVSPPDESVSTRQAPKRVVKYPCLPTEINSPKMYHGGAETICVSQVVMLPF